MPKAAIGVNRPLPFNYITFKALDVRAECVFISTDDFTASQSVLGDMCTLQRDQSVLKNKKKVGYFNAIPVCQAVY